MAVQIAGLPELLGAVEDGALVLVVPNDVTTPKPSLPEDSLPDVSEPEVSEPEINYPGY